VIKQKVAQALAGEKTFHHPGAVRPTVLSARSVPDKLTSMMLLSLKQPSAYLPLGMSIAALGLVLGHAALYGVVHEIDEGTPAHIFQILMAAQVPIVGFFAIKWLPRAPREALVVLALQALAGIAACASVFFLT
jgi:hypothetical protein